MPVSSFQRNVLFLCGSVATGLAVAVLVMHFWPEWVHPRQQPSATLTPSAPLVPPANPGVTLTRVAPANSSEGGSDAGRGADTLDAAGGRVALETMQPGSFAPAVRATAPAVVSVYAERTERVLASPLDSLLGGTLPPRSALGSGVIMDAQGHIVTNHHVIAGSNKIRVQLADGRVADAVIVGSDPDTDLAVMKINLSGLPVMPLGRSDRVLVGDVVLAIGTPLGLSQTVTHGIVSAVGRASLGVANYENFIQTDAAINVGNSGGALVSARGELIGINTAVLGKNLGAEGIGVAIPMDLVRGVMDEILRHGRVVRGWIGIDLRDAAPEDAARYGLPHAGPAIVDLYQDSPAVNVGLARFDMIEAVNGQEVHTAQDAMARIASHKPGSNVTLVGRRGAQRFKVIVKVIEAPVRNLQ
jgi:serine peptidase DegS